MLWTHPQLWPGVDVGICRGSSTVSVQFPLWKYRLFAKVGRGNAVKMDLGISKESCDVNGLDSGPIIPWWLSIEIIKIHPCYQKKVYVDICYIFFISILYFNFCLSLTKVVAFTIYVCICCILLFVFFVAFIFFFFSLLK